jgi:hypothetical protein
MDINNQKKDEVVFLFSLDTGLILFRVDVSHVIT